MAKLKEEWKQIEGYPDYTISNLGRIKKRLLVKLTLKDDGYYTVGLTNEDGTKRFSVHRLVFQHFRNSIERRHIVVHLNGKKKDNSANNLGLSGRSHVSDEDVRFIRANAKKLGGTMSNAELARKYGVTTVSIFKIVNGQMRKDVL